jgi:S-adenosylmethionine-diacylglycerol 3-amino-3-carboxypropyl transferase
VPGELYFSQVREDPLVDERIVRLVAARAGRPIRVLMIASGGCTALGLLALDEVDHIVAVDANPAQLQWVTLRRRAMAHLSLPRQLELIGATTGTGLLHAGRVEGLFRDLAAALRAAGLDPLGDPAAATASPHWRPVFERIFERGHLADLFGPAAVDYSMDRSFGAHFADVVARALQRWPAGTNYFLHQMLEQRYLDVADGRPPCLTGPIQAAARARGLHRLELRHQRFADAVDALPAEAPFDLVQMSNISDWMPVAELRAMLAHLAARIAPGGAVLGRRLNGDHHLQALFAEALEVDPALCAGLLAADRSFFYREVVVGFRRGDRP